MKRTFIDKKRIIIFFTFTLTLLPITSEYLFFSNNFTFGDFTLLFTFLILLFRSLIVGEKVKIVYPLLPFLVYIFAITFYAELVSDTSIRSDVLFRSGRYILYMSVILMYVKTYFDTALAFKIIKFVSIFATIYIIVQYLGIVILGTYIPGHLLFLPITRESVYSFNELIFEHHAYIRPRSIFDEPSEYAIFCVLYLFALLKSPDISVKDFSLALFITVGIIVSTSMIGLFIGVMIWMVFVVRFIIHSKFDKKVFLLLTGTALLVLILGNSQLMGLIDRVFSGGILRSERVEGLFLVFNQGFSILELLFGFGMIDYEVYGFMPAFTRLILYFGLFGFALLISAIGYIFVHIKNKARVLLVVFVVINTIDILLFGKFNLIYWALILCYKPIEESFNHESV